jgi:alkylhydroperoxidase/carboxymuconolactone decarboxylase family protein YurZ
MSEDASLSGKEKILVAMAAAMGGGCRTCAQGLYSMAGSEDATAEEIERAFSDGLVQRASATEVMREKAGALIGRAPDADAPMAPRDTRISELSRLAASVALNSAPDALKRLEAARRAGATEAEVRVAIGIGKSVRSKAQGFSDAELADVDAEELGCDGQARDPAPAAAGCCAQNETTGCG